MALEINAPSAWARIAGLAVSLLLAACTHSTGGGQTVRICDDGGCSNRPKSDIRFDDSQASASTVPNARIVELEARAQTHAPAAFDLGLRYFRGDGVRQDSYQAIVWMRKAAEAGDLQAQAALGGFYLSGLDEMGADPQEAEKWLSIAASRGDVQSKKLLPYATEAKQAAAADYQLRQQWRESYFRLWNAGYPYRGSWHDQVWYWR